MQFSVVKLMNWRVIHWVSYLCMKFIVHSFGPLRASKTLQDAHVFVWGWWPKRPMIVVFFDHCPHHKVRSWHWRLLRATSYIYVWARSGPCCHVPSHSRVNKLKAAMSMRHVRWSHSPLGIEFVMCSYFSFYLNYHQEQLLNWSKTTIWINGGVPSFHL